MGPTTHLLLAGLTSLLDDTSPTPLPIPTSPVAQVITVIFAGIAALITAVAAAGGFRRRRAAEADVQPPDPENSLTRIRERLRAAETRLDAYRELGLPDRVTRLETERKALADRVADLEERMDLRRAADVIAEAELAPRRTRRKAPPT